MSWQALPFLTGLIIGLSITVPIGAIGALCLRKTLVEGLAVGWVFGLAAATTSAFYAGIGGFQITSISNYFSIWLVWLRGLGGLFLLYLGVRTFLATPTSRISSHSKASFIGIYVLIFLLTLASPLTIVPFTAIFPGFGLDKVIGDNLSATALIIGVFIGSTLWWLIPGIIIHLRHITLSVRAIRWVNRVSGVIIAITGLVAVLSLVPML